MQLAERGNCEGPCCRLKSTLNTPHNKTDLQNMAISLLPFGGYCKHSCVHVEHVT